MLSQLQQFASSEAEVHEAGILENLGIDFTLLILQAIAFLLMVWVLAKFVYPVFMRIIDEREAKIAESTKAADEAKEKADEAAAEVQKVLKKARSEASDIVATAKEEASTAIAKAEEKAKSRAEKIVASGQEQIKKDIQAAQKTLHDETLELVAQATETIIKTKLTDASDTSLVKSAVQEAAK